MQGLQRMVTKWSNNYRFGLDNDPLENFFESIQIYQNASRHRYTCSFSKS